MGGTGTVPGPLCYLLAWLLFVLGRAAGPRRNQVVRWARRGTPWTRRSGLTTRLPGSAGRAPAVPEPVRSSCRVSVEDCITILRGPNMSNDWRKSPRWAPAFEDSEETGTPPFLFLDPPDNTRLRGLVSRAFTPRRVEAVRPLAQRVADDAFDRAERSGGMEVVSELAFPLPVMVICELLGVPAKDVDEFSEWSATMTRGIDPSFTWPPGLLQRFRELRKRAMDYLVNSSPTRCPSRGRPPVGPTRGRGTR